MKTFCSFGFALLAILNAGWPANLGAQPNLTAIRGELPFKLYGGFLIMLEGQIGDHGKLKFVLDTGVTHSVIDRRLADRISGPRRQSGKVLSFDKAISAEWVEVPEIDFGPVHVSNFSMMIGDLKYFQSFATQVDAVIGLDLLRLSSFSIDYETHRVTFGPVTSSSGVPMDIGDFCLTVQLIVGESKIRLLVDTGAQALVFYEDRVADPSTGDQLTRDPVLPLREARVVATAAREDAADRRDCGLVDDNAWAPPLALEPQAFAERSVGCPWLDEAVYVRVPLPCERRRRVRALE